MILVRKLVCKSLWASRGFIDGFDGSSSRGCAPAGQVYNFWKKIGRNLVRATASLGQKTTQEHRGQQ